MVLLILIGASGDAALLWLGGLYNHQLRNASLPQTLIHGAGSA
jgi:hypothetical protein